MDQVAKNEAIRNFMNTYNQKPSSIQKNIKIDFDQAQIMWEEDERDKEDYRLGGGHMMGGNGE